MYLLSASNTDINALCQVVGDVIVSVTENLQVGYARWQSMLATNSKLTTESWR